MNSITTTTEAITISTKVNISVKISKFPAREGIIVHELDAEAAFSKVIAEHIFVESAHVSHPHLHHHRLRGDKDVEVSIYNNLCPEVSSLKLFPMQL